MSTEAFRLRLTLKDLERAMFGFSPSERRDTASFFIDAIGKIPDLFDRIPGKISATGAELWITDQETKDRHHVSLGSDKKGVVGYERVDRNGKVVQALTDQMAAEKIADSLTNIGVLIVVED